MCLRGPVDGVQNSLWDGDVDPLGTEWQGRRVDSDQGPRSAAVVRVVLVALHFPGRGTACLTDQPLQVQLDSLFGHRKASSTAGQQTAGQIRNDYTEVRVRVFVENNWKIHARSIQPACLKIARRVPKGRSRLAWGTVTNPPLAGCLYCRWLPVLRTSRHPSRTNRLMTSRLLMSLLYTRYTLWSMRLQPLPAAMADEQRQMPTSGTQTEWGSAAAEARQLLDEFDK